MIRQPVSYLLVCHPMNDQPAVSFGYVGEISGRSQLYEQPHYELIIEKVCVFLFNTSDVSEFENLMNKGIEDVEAKQKAISAEHPDYQKYEEYLEIVREIRFMLVSRRVQTPTQAMLFDLSRNMKEYIPNEKIIFLSVQTLPDN